jgi:hypothetical protein
MQPVFIGDGVNCHSSGVDERNLRFLRYRQAQQSKKTQRREVHDNCGNGLRGGEHNIFNRDLLSMPPAARALVGNMHGQIPNFKKYRFIPKRPQTDS